MDPLLSNAVAHARITELHHEAARRRLAHQVSTPRPHRLITRAASLPASLRQWLATRGRAVRECCQTEPACCAA
jgi:hypothetical protein